MDKGAHFYKTDFQIHSPRDALWVGDGITKWPKGKPVSHEERLLFARGFITKCRELGIRAVGITDHHDICFIKYFQVAAQEENNASGIPTWDSILIQPEKQKPIIFPGIEVTLSVPCQCIILLDADSDLTTQAELLEAIEIGNTYSDNHENGPTVNPIHLTLLELDKKISTYANKRLKGRYIILPHVGDSGYKTILRDGFNCHFAQMPCVGGYIEQDWSDHQKKHLFDGIDVNYGYKTLGIFQTTDSRREDFADLGKRNTWVKFAQPTAEALRQACLAKESRISQNEPIWPTKFISKIEVSTSSFMGTINVEFNPQYNALIGGRGTGKSTILEYLRFGLHDQELSEERKRFVNDTLLNLKPILKIHWIIEGSSQTIVHDFGANIKYLQVEGGPPKEITEDYIRQNFPIQSYSQKQLSTISNRTEELQRFIIQPIQEAVKEFDEKINNLRTECRNLYQEVIQRRQKERTKRDLIAQKESLEAQKEAIQKSIPTIDQDTKKIIEEYPRRKNDLALVVSCENKINDMLAYIDKLHTDISVGLSLPEGVADFTPEVNPIFNKADELLEKARVAIEKLKDEISGDKNSLDDLVVGYKKGYADFLQRYEDASQKTLAHKGKIQQLKNVMDFLSAAGNGIVELEKEIKILENAEYKFSDKMNEWVSLHNQKANLLEEQCRKLSEKSGDEIKAELKRGADIENAINKLNEALKGARISSDRWDSLKNTIIKTESPVEKWTQLIKELRLFAEMEVGDIIDKDKIPSFSLWELTDNAKSIIIEKLSPDKWFEIAFTSLNDIPIFYYKKNREAIPFEDASAGQQATALLKVLLQEEKGPLLIDQPEDDLDKKVIEEIIQSIWQAKQKRQIIFASHDANLVVNGDAELVIHCDYESDTNRNKGKIENTGSIDVKEIRDAITTIMEGGQKAFNLRKKKYGF
jgi:type III restriction enzyme